MAFRRAFSPVPISPAMAKKGVVAAASSIAASGTRSKRKASAISVAVAPAPAVAAPPTTSASAISPALKKRRAARAHVSPIPFPALYDSKEVIELGDDDDGTDGVRVVDVAASPPSETADDVPEPVEPVRVVKPDIHMSPQYAGQVRVLQHDGETYDSMLTRACLYQQQNEFVLIQALESESNEYYVWMRSGLMGSIGDTVMEGPWMTREDALSRFRQIFLSKTMLHWGDRHSPRYGEGSYTWIETEQASEDNDLTSAASTEASGPARKRRSAKKSRARAPRKVVPRPATELHVPKSALPSENTPPPSRLDLEVQSFLTIAIEAASAYAYVDNRYIYAAKPTKKPPQVKDDVVVIPIPLGKLSKTTIQRGFEALHRIHDALQCNADRTVLTHLSNRFFSVIPHPELAIIDSMVRLTEKVQMLVALCVHGDHRDLLQPDLSRRYFVTNHLDACYNSLECRLFPLLPSSREYGLVQSYIFNSFCCVGNNFGAEGKLITVFRVEKPAEAVRFSPYRSASNRRILWHGSRMSNWMGILKHGLLITPTGVPLNGSSLGAGLYFTDKISKAMAYSHASNERQVFLLSEVALGACKPSTNGIRASASSTGVHHSCYGVGRCVPDTTGDYVDAFGAIWPLGKATQTKDARATHNHNEFVVYNVAQARMRYIVITRPLY